MRAFFRRLRPDPTHRPGPAGEHAAARFLRRQGYRILARNCRNRFGEVDLLALAPDRRTLVLVEVKTRVGDQGPPPEWRVGRDKQRKLTALAAQLARRHRLTDRPWRFDVIGVDLHPRHTKQPPTIRHHPAAFEARL